MESDWIGMNVGVSVGVTGAGEAGGTGVSVAGIDATTVAEAVGVDNTSTEKLHESSNSELTIRTITSKNNLFRFIVFSLFSP
jgi:hypothetical protein